MKGYRKNTKDHSLRKSGGKLRKKLQKKAEAEIRQAEYDKLSLEEKIARAKSRPGNSKKELEKLMK